jgi:hypothetical protein
VSSRRYIAAAVVAGSCVVAGCGHDDAAPAPAPRAGLIVPQHSVDSIALGMSQAQVRRLLGQPTNTVNLGVSDSETYAGQPIYEWRYPSRRLTVDFRSVKGRSLSVSAVETTSGRLRTESGAGVGVTQDELSARVEHLDCADSVCTLGGRTVDQPQTVFELRGDRVAVVRVTRVF